MPAKTKAPARDTIDLQKLIEIHIWEMYKRDARYLRKIFLRKSLYNFDIRLNHLCLFNETKKVQGHTTEKDKIKYAEVKAMVFENMSQETQMFTISGKTTFQETTAKSLDVNKSFALKSSIQALPIAIGINRNILTVESESKGLQTGASSGDEIQVKVPKQSTLKLSIGSGIERIAESFIIQTTVTLPFGPVPVSVKKRQRVVGRYFLRDLYGLYELLKQGNDMVTYSYEENDKQSLSALVINSKCVVNAEVEKEQIIQVECQPIKKKTTLIPRYHLTRFV